MDILHSLANEIYLNLQDDNMKKPRASQARPKAKPSKPADKKPSEPGDWRKETGASAALQGHGDDLQPVIGIWTAHGDLRLETRLENVQDYPNIKPWIGNRSQWNDILRSFSGGATLGGQKRRLGRFLFACNASEFLKALKVQVAELKGRSYETDVTFHVCAGLAGGTGSGSIVDTLSQIRKVFPYSSAPSPSLPDQFRILVYAGLPDTLPRPNWDTGNYHANGYAALAELNGFGVGKLEPHDVSGNGERLKVITPFNGCYLFLNENENT